MKYFISFFQKFLLPKELPKKLGRWNIENCNEKLKVKVDLSNEDHCGPCGQYVKKQRVKQYLEIDMSLLLKIVMNVRGISERCGVVVSHFVREIPFGVGSNLLVCNNMSFLHKHLRIPVLCLYY